MAGAQSSRKGRPMQWQMLLWVFGPKTFFVAVGSTVDVARKFIWDAWVERVGIEEWD